MGTRSKASAPTRRAILDATKELLNIRGPDAVTAREVGARAGVSRSTPYRHFTGKADLLTALEVEAWKDLGDAFEALAVNSDAAPERSLHRALVLLVTLGRSQPHLYRLMFTTPATDETAAVRPAAERARHSFLDIVDGVVGLHQARQCATLLLASAHGITGLEVSGHLEWEESQTTAEDLVGLLIDLVSRHPGPPVSPPGWSDPKAT